MATELTRADLRDDLDEVLEGISSDDDLRYVRAIARDRGISEQEATEFALEAGIRYLRKTGRSDQDIEKALREARPTVMAAGASDYLLERMAERRAKLDSDVEGFIREAFEGALQDRAPGAVDPYARLLAKDLGKTLSHLVDRGFEPGRIARAMVAYSEARGGVVERGRAEDPDALVMMEVRRIAAEPPSTGSRRAVVRFFRLAWLLAARDSADDSRVEETLLGFCIVWSCTPASVALHAVAQSLLLEIARSQVFLLFLTEGARWVACAMPVVRVEAKIAAALVFTDLPSDFVDASIRLPWPCFKVVPLEGVLVGDSPVREISVFRQHTPSGDHLRMTVFFESGEISLSREVPSLSRLAAWAENEREQDLRSAGLSASDIRVISLCGKLVVGTCLRMSDPTAVRRRSSKAVRASGFLGQGRSSTSPQTSEFVLGGDVRVDLREALRGYSQGRAGFRYRKVQWLVHGHWRNQAHGPGRADRKMIWIEPYFKGPEKAAVAVRDHVIK